VKVPSDQDRFALPRGMTKIDEDGARLVNAGKSRPIDVIIRTVIRNGQRRAIEFVGGDLREKGITGEQ
jgi:hypothetical protein